MLDPRTGSHRISPTGPIACLLFTLAPTYRTRGNAVAGHSEGDHEGELLAKLALIGLGRRVGAAQACLLMGFSRDSFYRLDRLFRENRIDGVRTSSRREPLLATRTPPEIEAASVALASEQPSGARCASPRRCVAVACPSPPLGRHIRSR